MLVLSRREHEAIVIHHAGEELRVVVWTEDGRIKVGIDSPPTFVAMREELLSGSDGGSLATTQEHGR